MTDRDPILTALQDWRGESWHKFLTDGARTGPEQVYDRGVLEGLRWAIDTYKAVTTDEEER